ncbi:hypothetical protein [Parafrankia elaeagni]|uniref:hypothetical protein n=1 Tax=Parafrankia elaeagni TaxID=222534 RepID=UPI00039DD2A2|nr:hypothetical protein [Parafrankia elaeagni]
MQGFQGPPGQGLPGQGLPGQGPGAGRAGRLAGRLPIGAPAAPAPPPPVQGRIVFDSAWFPLREHASSGFSLMGSRRVLITDHPAVYVHETSVLGAGAVCALEPAVDPDVTVELVAYSSRLVVDLRLPAGRTLSASTPGPLPPEALATLTGLHGRLLPDAVSTTFVSPCAVSVTPLFEDDPVAAPAGPGPVTATTAMTAAAGSTAVAPAAAPELTAYVVVRGGRLELRSRGRTLVEWPRNRIELSAAGPAAAQLRGGAVLDGRFLTGAILHLVTPQVLHAFLSATAPTPGSATSVSAGGTAPGPTVVPGGGPVALTKPGDAGATALPPTADTASSGPSGVAGDVGAVVATAGIAGAGAPGTSAPGTSAGGTSAGGTSAVGTSAPVSARGVAGSSETARLDCVLHDTTLELQELHSSQVVARFDLVDPRLRVAGSAERFVIFDPDQGPVTVQSESAVFGRRLHQHPALRTAAELTLAEGPYPAELADGRPVACAVAADALRVRGPGVDLLLPHTDLRLVDGTSTESRAELRVATAAAETTIVGQLELVRAVHTEIVAGRHALADPRDIPDMLRAAVGLEEDYFLYTIFGPFYELHSALLGSAGAGVDVSSGGGGGGGGGSAGAGLGGRVPLPADDESRARTAAMLAEGLVELQRHLDQVGSVLPAFVRHRDARLLEPLTGGREPAWLKAQETRLRSALAPAQRAAAETGQLAAQVARLFDLDPAALPRPDYTSAAVSLGVAALLNPVFLVSGASQVYTRYAQGEKRTAAVGAQSARGWATVLDRWNTLVTTTLPVLGYVLTENLFALRWETARRLAQELRGAPADSREAVLRGVGRRLARLDVLRRYPANAGIRVGRGAIADHVRAARDAVSTPRFADF